MKPLKEEQNSATSRIDYFWLELRREWQSGNRVNVEEIVKRSKYQDLTPDEMLDLIYAEFSLRNDVGENPHVDEYIERFPEYRDELPQLFEAHQVFHAGIFLAPDLFETIPADEVQKAQTTMSNTTTTSHLQIGKYRTIKFLGEGGQASVYRAVNPLLDQEVVIKYSHYRVQPNSPIGRRLVMEGRILTELRHPNIAQIFDLDEHEGHPFIVMEYIPGRNLLQYFRQKELSPQELAQMLAQVARAVAHAHNKNTVHLDIKPENIVVGDDGIPRLIDFGLAHINPAYIGELDTPTERTGTLLYMAPERARGDSGVSLELVDIFGLGGVLYFLLTGNSPYQGETRQEILESACSANWNSRPLDQSSIPTPLAKICKKCLEKEPADRYQSADALALELEQFANQSSVHRKQLVFGGIAALVTLAFALYFLPFENFTKYSNGIDNQQKQAQHESIRPLKIRVWNINRFRDIMHALPLQRGDNIQVAGDLPSGFYSKLFWVDASGKLHTLANFQRAPEKKELTYPGLGKTVPLEGPPGTELILLCGRTDRPVAQQEIAQILSRVKSWPILPPTMLLQVDNDTVERFDTEKAPGQPKNVPDPEAIIRRDLDQMRSQLQHECHFILGVAFSFQ